MGSPTPHQPPGRDPGTSHLPRSRGQELESAFRFFGSFLRRPTRVGSVVPSSAVLARALTDPCPLETVRSVVELGPGTGAITGPILQRLSPQARFLAIEVDAGHARALSVRFPGLIVCHDSAEHLERHVREHQLGAVDCVISGLPWAVMNPALQNRILRPAVRSLGPEGIFVAFGYAHARWFPATRRFRRLLESQFVSVQTSRTVWRNLPPAFIYLCRGPRHQPTPSPNPPERTSNGSVPSPAVVPATDAG